MHLFSILFYKWSNQIELLDFFNKYIDGILIRYLVINSLIKRKITLIFFINIIKFTWLNKLSD